jgi:hypothetical protein
LVVGHIQLAVDYLECCWWVTASGSARSGGCSDGHLIDVQNAVIVDVEASTAVRQAEVTAAKRMIERVHDERAYGGAS